MRYFLVFLLIALAATSELKEKKSPLNPFPLLRCLLINEKIERNVVVIYDAVLQFFEDQNVFLLSTKILSAYPEIENQVKKCFEKK